MRPVRRQCARPGCSAIATATFTFDAWEQTVWLDAPADGQARAGELCERHARALTPPQGWRLDDRREARVDRAAGRTTVQSRATDADVDPAAGVAAGQELRMLLQPHSPLLARAFRSAGSL